MNAERKAIFFDRDGIVNYRHVGNYVKSKSEFKFLKDFLFFFSKLETSGFLKILITNQQGVGKGVLELEQLNDVHNYMQNKLKEKAGFNFDDIFYCTDLAGTNSPRRKPNPGMLLEAIEKWNINPSESWMIGDSPSDVIAGKKAGVNTILISNLPENKVDEADFAFINFEQVYNYFAENNLFKNI
jgi:D-glycero-D-manno-heptose 1,7-bisphosphate phosphatase